MISRRMSFVQSLTRAALLLGVLASALSADARAAQDPLDWPSWRGPEQNGISREKNIVTEWNADGENVLWESKELGTRSTPIVMNGKLYTLAPSAAGTPQEQEQVICADAATGKILWQTKFNVYLSDVPRERVAWGCVIGDPDTGRIYAMGVCNYFVCLDGETGKTLWSHSLNEEYGTLNTYGGRTNTPIIFEDLVIINAVTINWGDYARPQHRFLAFDKNNGELVWFNGTRPLPDDTTYSTPTTAVIGGRQAMAFGSGDGGVWAFETRTGRPLWQYKLSMRGINVSPVIDGDTVFMSQSEENPDGNTMGAIAAINSAATYDGSDITENGALWRHKEVMIGKSSPLLVDGKLYGMDDSGVFFVFDAKSGEQIGRKQKLAGTIARASLLYADGKIYACTTTVWHVLEPDPERGAKVVHRLRLPDQAEVHGSPIISHGRLYLPTTEGMFCLGLKDAQPVADPRPALPQESPKSDADPVAHVQLVPCESLIRPGEKVLFRARLFNDRGQMLKEVDAAEYTATGGGQIDGRGLFQAGTENTQQGVVITAKVDGVTGTARVRIIPPLPWSFDFTNGQVPVTWIGARVRYVAREVDGEPMLVKVTTVPKGTRSQSIIGPPDLHDYTIQADVRGQSMENKLPDIGLIAQRYTFDMMGESQKLQIRSWTSQLDRFSKDLPFEWQPDVWYTMKFQASTDGGKAVLKGKVWKRGEPEPEAWTIEATDEYGNATGSPGLYGNATNGEIYIDNLQVTPN